jgi:hypothetical protein
MNFFKLFRRPPDYIVGDISDPYLKRWWIVPRNKYLNIYLHHFLRSDDDRALHDHMYDNVSILLHGAYNEQKTNGKRYIKAPNIIFRKAATLHRIELIDNCSTWTLFITGPRYREWGFSCPQGWRPWQKFVDMNNPGLRGPGCD